MKLPWYLIFLIVLVFGCNDSNSSEEVIKQSKKEVTAPEEEKVEPNPPENDIPFGWDVPTNVWPACSSFWRPIAQATYKMAHKDDTPHMYMAQGRQESLCNPKAESHVGAQGFFQIMPGTEKDIEKRWGFGEFDPWKAGESIRAGLWYNQKVRSFWNPEFRSYCDRIMLMFSGYNGGNGHWLNAQKLAKKRGEPHNGYYDMAKYLPVVNSHGARENLHYVYYITKKWERIEPDHTCGIYDATHFLTEE